MKNRWSKAQRLVRAEMRAQLRDLPTDELIVKLLVNVRGEMLRRELARRVGHRFDFAAALGRLARLGNIELVSKAMPGRRPQQIVRLTGKAAAGAGVGFIRMGEST